LGVELHVFDADAETDVFDAAVHRLEQLRRATSVRSE